MLKLRGFYFNLLFLGLSMVFNLCFNVSSLPMLWVSWILLTGATFGLFEVIRKMEHLFKYLIERYAFSSTALCLLTAGIGFAILWFIGFVTNLDVLTSFIVNYPIVLINWMFILFAKLCSVAKQEQKLKA